MKHLFTAALIALTVSASAQRIKAKGIPLDRNKITWLPAKKFVICDGGKIIFYVDENNKPHGSLKRAKEYLRNYYRKQDSIQLAKQLKTI